MTDLSRLTVADIDALPFGFIGLAPDGTIRKYNRYGKWFGGRHVCRYRYGRRRLYGFPKWYHGNRTFGCAHA